MDLVALRTMFVALALSAAGSISAHAADPPAKTFESAVRPIFAARCFKCHGDDVQKGELDLSTRSGVLKGGESGAIVAAGKPDESLLYEMVRDRHMPPKGETPLTDAEIKAIHDWIAGGAPFATSGEEGKTVSQHDVLPILLLRCTVCHGAHVKEGDLDLRSKEAMLKGGKSGPAIVPGRPEESLLLKKIRSEEMPPRRRVVEVSIKPIEPAEVAVIERWIAAGAPESPIGPDVATTEPDPLVSDEDRQFWSFQPPRRTSPPQIPAAAVVRNEIDPFILDKLSAARLSPAPNAERAVLIRRLTYDLIGLPPSPDDVDDFLNDAAPDAWERLTDRLLASPHYGERWGRYWLDLAGYSDSTGVQHADPTRDHIWRYRDYVIRALNADKPYDRFLAEQIAGDELADYENAREITPEIYDNLVATGFLRLTPDGTHANITNFVPDRLDIIADELNVLSSTVLGLTVKCARCHSHKTDPIPQRDYYRLAAVFKGAYDEHDWLRGIYQAGNKGPWGERRLEIALPEERLAWEGLERQLNHERDEARALLQARTEELQRKHFEERLAKLPADKREPVRGAINTPADKRTDAQKALAEKYEAMLKVSVDELKKLEPDFRTLSDQIDARFKSIEARRKPVPSIQALWDRGEPSPTYILRRGDHKSFGREVGPGVLSVLTDGRTPFVVEPPWPGAKSTGRRLAFTRWLTQPNHPLTARVMVNRLWRHHFGAGIVATLDNFGKTGAAPTHPELLDNLACEFVRREWSVKQMHRLMTGSATYRQSSLTSDAAEKVDPENKLLSHMPLRRLEAEALRDALLAVSGRFNDTPFGPPDLVETAASGMVTDKGSRRTIYVIQRRTTILTLLEDFDLPAMNPNCIDRPISTVAPQALHLLNSKGIHDWSAQFAARVRDLAGVDPSRRIEAAWRLAFSRSPTADEASAAQAMLSELTAQWSQAPPDAALSPADRALVNLCHALFNSAEFLMID
jgi:cytochrome c553